MIPSAPLGTDAARGSYDLGAASGAAPHGDGPERRFRFELAAHPGSPAQARRLTRARLAGWAVCEDTRDTAALVISELVTNAVVHTASTVVACELQDGVDIVRIAVRDEGCAPTEPHPCAQRTEEEQGRGLLLVEHLCRAWGAQESGTGLLVWAEVPRQTTADEPRGDLGWGARPKPGPAQDDSEEEDEAEAYGRDAGRTQGLGRDAGHAQGFGRDAGRAQGLGRDAGHPQGFGRDAEQMESYGDGHIESYGATHAEGYGRDVPHAESYGRDARRGAGHGHGIGIGIGGAEGPDHHAGRAETHGHRPGHGTGYGHDAGRRIW
ncbi:hypothetical protein SUDANB96_01681 [Streptomyces sp. enrichment culture]